MLDAPKLPFRLGNMLLLAGKVARGLREARLELCLARLSTGLLALKRVALDAQSVKDRGSGRLLVAQRLELFGGLGPLAQGLALSLGLLRYVAKSRLERAFL